MPTWFKAVTVLFVLASAAFILWVYLADGAGSAIVAALFLVVTTVVPLWIDHRSRRQDDGEGGNPAP